MSDERRKNQRGRRTSDKTDAADARGRRASDKRADRKFFALAWGLTVVILVLFVLLIGLGFVVKHLRTNQEGLRKAQVALVAQQKTLRAQQARTDANTAAVRDGTCVIVATLENGAASVRASLQHPVAPLPPDRRSQLQQSLAFQVGLANSLRARVTCPDPPPSTKVPKGKAKATG